MNKTSIEKKGNRENAAGQLWATTREYATIRGISRRTVQDRILAGRIEVKTRKRNGRGPGSGYKVLIIGPDDVNRIMKLREEPKIRPREKEIASLKAEVDGLRGENDRLKIEKEALRIEKSKERAALPIEDSKELEKSRDAAAKLVKHYEKEKKKLCEELEAAKANADEAVKADLQKELEESQQNLVEMSKAGKEKDKKNDKLKEDIAKLKDQVMAREGDAKATIMARMDMEIAIKKEINLYKKMMGEGDIKDTGKVLQELIKRLEQLVKDPIGDIWQGKQSE